MSFIVEIRISADDFVLTRTMNEYPESRLEFERFIPTSPSETRHYLWVGGSSLNPRSFRTTAASDPTVSDLRLVDDLTEGLLFRVQWNDTRNPIIANWPNGDETLIRAVGKANDWFLKIRFGGREALSCFQSYCNGEDIPLNLVRLYESHTLKQSHYGLSVAQRDAIVVALEMGYFDVPRNCKLSDVADELDISVNAVSERIRRGEANLFRSALTIPSPSY